MRVLVVIPAYNEAETVADVALRACRYADRVIIVDDGSQDDTGKRLEGLPVSVLGMSGTEGRARACGTACGGRSPMARLRS
jgi:glycosyltransferase involved in cell wall biosynthesis